jgi:hypothetical protein
MLCDKYKDALIKAAASGAALPNGLREHVEACTCCAAKLAAEQTLFAAVDAGLHRAANARLRFSFLPNVKATLATETVRTRNPIPGWAFVCATGALALAAAFLNLPRGAHEARTEAITVTSKAAAGVGGAGLRVAPERKTRYSARAFKAHKQQSVSDVTSHEPKVLVQPEEEQFLKAFYATARNPVRDARPVVTEDREITPKPLLIEQIQVRDLKIENLDEESGLAQTGTK